MRVRAVLATVVTVAALAFFAAPAFASAASAPIVVTPAPASVAAPTSVTPAQIQPNGYLPVTPCRIFDTRPHGSTGLCAGAPPMWAPFAKNQARDVPMAALLGGGVVPWGATAVVLNVTVVGATAPTYVTVYPAGTGRPLASSLNVTGSSAVANLVTVSLGPEGLTASGLHFYNFNGSADVIADLEGYFTPLSTATSGYNPLTPCRAFDTRGTGPLCTGAAARKGKVGPGHTLTIKMTGVGGIPASGVRSVVFNLTAVNGTASTYEKVYPTGATQPLTSNLNVRLRQAVANLVSVPVNQTAGTITIYNLGGQVDLLGDLAGYYASTGAAFYPTSPCRAFDSRTGTGNCLPNSLSARPGPLLGTVPVQLLIPGIGPIPVPAVIKAVAFNLTVVNASMSTYLTVFPAGGSRPNASNIDVYTKSALSNAVIAQVPSTGARVGFVQVQNEIGSIDFIVDLAGYYL